MGMPIIISLFKRFFPKYKWRTGTKKLTCFFFKIRTITTRISALQYRMVYIVSHEWSNRRTKGKKEVRKGYLKQQEG